jgi:hypothetical protein
VLCDRFDPSPPLDHVVTGVARGGEDIGGEVEVAPLECRQPLEQSHKGLLGRIGCVVRGAERSQAEAVYAALVAVVELGEGVPVAGDRKPRKHVIGRRPEIRWSLGRHHPSSGSFFHRA